MWALVKTKIVSQVPVVVILGDPGADFPRPHYLPLGLRGCVVVR